MIKLIEKLVERGIKSVHEHEKSPNRLRGCLAGFELVRHLRTTADFERVLAERRSFEARMSLDGTVPIDDYWEYRCATAQVEHAFEVVKVAVGGYPTVSARAVIYYHELVSN